MPAQARVFVLEQGAPHPRDVALPPGRHELRDCGVAVDFDGARVTVSWLGFFPSAFLLPSPRQLQRGRGLPVEPSDRIAWAGREWKVLPHDLPGDQGAPARGTSLNEREQGTPVQAVLLLTRGKDRGNFLRVRTSPTSLAPGVEVRATLDDEHPADRPALVLHVSKDLAQGAVQVDDTPVPPGSELPLTAEQRLTFAGDDDATGSAVVVCG